VKRGDRSAAETSALRKAGRETSLASDSAQDKAHAAADAGQSEEFRHGWPCFRLGSAKLSTFCAGLADKLVAARANC
jgi:hypothetical protein